MAYDGRGSVHLKGGDSLMNVKSRREFMQQSAVGIAATSLIAQKASAQTVDSAPGSSAGDILAVGLIGAGGMGSNHLGLLVRRPDVHVTHVCDVDQQRLDEAVQTVESNTGRKPEAGNDLRRMLDDRSLDAVFIASPDHWHAPAAILALEAGKHVYVEKPCCHNLREGELLAAACQRTGKLLQVGTQSRSTEFVRQGIEHLRSGAIGEVLVAKAWNSQRRSTIGKASPAAPPPQLDFDFWLGPAPEVPYRSNLLHASWRWFYDFGCGDIGNDGVHDIDVALWGLDPGKDPATAACLGRKCFFDDDQQFPDTQYAIFDFPQQPGGSRAKQLVFEQRIWSPYVQEGYENGAAFYGTDGMLILGHSVGWKLFGPRNELLKEVTGSSDLAAHHQNFFDCIRGQQSGLNADVTAGVRAAAIVHLANIAARVQRVLQYDPASVRIRGDDEADAMVTRRYRDGHWAVPRLA